MSAIEKLEGRVFLSVTAEFANNFLAVTGTAGNDNVVVSIRGSGGQFMTVVRMDRVRIAAFAGKPTGVYVNMAGGNDSVHFVARGLSNLPFFATVEGGPGRDRIRVNSDLVVHAHGNDGNDKINVVGDIGRHTAHSLHGNDGNDYLVGSYAGEALHGGNGSDVMYGKEGNDFMDGGSDPDFLDGGPGNDLLIGGTGTDILLGGNGNDELQIVQNDDGPDWIVGGRGFDKLVKYEGVRHRKPSSIEEVIVR